MWCFCEDKDLNKELHSLNEWCSGFRAASQYSSSTENDAFHTYGLKPSGATALVMSSHKGSAEVRVSWLKVFLKLFRAEHTYPSASASATAV